MLTQRFFFCPSPHKWHGSRCTWGWEGTQPGQLTPNDHNHMDIPYCMVLCSAYRVGEEGLKERGSECCVFLSKAPLWVMEPCFPGNGLSWEVVKEFLVFLCLCVAFAFPIKLPWSQATNFLTFTLPILSLAWNRLFSNKFFHVRCLKRQRTLPFFTQGNKYFL